MLVDFLINITLALMMFNIGASLRFSDFKRIIKHIKPVVLGMSLQMIALPLLTFLILYFLPISAEYKMGIFILSLCPGGSTSNFVSYLVRADVALSVLLTGINSFIILFSLPALTTFGYFFFFAQTDVKIQLPYFDIIMNILAVAILPVLLGILFRHYFTVFAGSIQKTLKIVSITSLFLVFTIKLFGSSAQGGSGLDLKDLWTLLPPLLFIHLVTLFASYFIAKKLINDQRKSVTIGIEVGLQNTALALLVATVLLGNETLGKPAVIYSGFSFFTTYAFGWWMMRAKTQQ